MKNIIIFSLAIIFISCSKSGNVKVYKFLDKYEEVVNVWANKSESSSGLTFADLNEMNKLNMELASEANTLKGTETWTPEQLDRYSTISLKFASALSKSSGNIGENLDKNFGNAMKDYEKEMQKTTKDFEKEMQKLKDLY